MVEDTARWQRVKSVVAAALEMPPDRWAEHLERSCGNDPQVRDAARALLEAHEQVADTFLEGPLWSDGAAASTLEPDPRPSAERGQRIGPYRLQRKLGEGGMGEVWLADQQTPIRRKVALKLIKLGMDTRQVLVRFEAERQALALMSHPNVARVLDAGATAEGRPFFTMDYVDGEPITDYCDRRRLTTTQRIELFIRVCRGVQHAHQKGIIHRDLKPSNILVAVDGDDAVPRIIDFGVAKATELRLTDESVLTQFGAMIGTPAYMSPEQAETTGVDIDTRTDVYSLGVVLYELLVDVTPIPVSIHDPLEQRRRIREDEPPRPSTRIGGMDRTEASEIATIRSSTAVALQRELRDGLDWLVMTALEKDRGRRYGTANELAEDLQRFLDHLPVKASPPDAWYRLGKFVRRNRTGVLAGAAVFTALLFGLVAEEIRRVQAESARREAVVQAEVANAALKFVTDDLLGSVDPDKAQGREITVREVFDAASKRFEGHFVDQPRVDAQLNQTFGDVYVRLQQPAIGAPFLHRALELRRQVFGDESPEVAETLASLAMCEFTRQYGSPLSIDYAEQALAIRERVLGPDAPLTNLVRGLLAMYRAVAGGKASSGLDNPMLVMTMISIRGKGETPEQLKDHFGTMVIEVERLWAGGKREAALDLIRVELRPFLENSTYVEQVPFAFAGYSQRLLNEGLANAAEASATLALQVGEDRLGAGHRYTLLAARTLGHVKSERGDVSAARDIFARWLPKLREVRGEAHSETLLAANRLTQLYAANGEFDLAETLHRELLETVRAELAPQSVPRLDVLWSYARFLTERRRFAEAEPLMLEAWEVERVEGAADRRALAVERLVALYEEWGKPERAARLRSEGYPIDGSVNR